MNHRFVDEPIPGYPALRGVDERGGHERGSDEHDAAPARPAPPTELTVIAWSDPMLERLGFDVRGDYVERFWVSVIGPTSTLLLRRLAHGLELNPDGFDLDAKDWATELGVGTKGGRNGPFWRSIDRCCRFGAASRNGATIAVRTKLPALTLRQVDRLPPHLQAAHAAWLRPNAA